MVSERKVAFYLYLTLLIAAIFGTYLAATRMTDPFLYFDISFAKAVNSQGELVFPQQGPFSSLHLAAGRQVLMLQLINMMGISPDIFQFLPIGTIFVSLTLYLLAYQILKSPLVASLITLYLVINLSHASALYSTFAYALGFPIMLGFFVLGRSFLQHRNLKEFPLLLILFSALNFIHYTLAVWTILFAISASIVIELQRFLSAKRNAFQLKPVFYLSTAFFVLFLIFNQTLYESYIPNLAPETLESAIQRFFSFFVFSPENYESPYTFSRSPQINITSTITLILILIPVTIGFMVDLKNVFIVKSDSATANPEMPIIWAFIILGIIDALAYSIRGSISTKSFSMIFPLVALYYLGRLRRPFLYYCLTVMLLLTSIIKIPLFHEQSYFIRGNSASPAELRHSANWVNSHIDTNNYAMMADLYLYGKYLSLSVEDGHTPILDAFNEEKYIMVVEGLADATELRPPEFIAIDKLSTQPTIGFIWNVFLPLGNFLEQIRANNDLYIIYEDEYVLLARFLYVDQVR